MQATIAKDRAAFTEPPPEETPYLFSEATGFVREEETAAIFMARICAKAAAHLRAAAALADWAQTERCSITPASTYLLAPEKRRSGKSTGK